MAKRIPDADDEKARPRGDTGQGDTGVPPNEQGISNRPGDAEPDAESDDDQFDEDDESETDA